MITLSRRKLLGGLGLLIAAPAIVKASSLMPVKAWAETAEVSSAAYWMDSNGCLWKHEWQTGLWSKLSYDLPSCSIYTQPTVIPDISPALEAALGGSVMYRVVAEPLHAGQPVVLR